MNTEIETDADRQDADDTFVASAAALVASHTMADTAWRTYFPELPAKQPELRTVLMDLHRCALLNQSPNLSDARRMIEDRFDIEEGAARRWTDQLEELGFLVRLPDKDKKSAWRLVPSAEAKVGLQKVGQDYLLCLGQLVGQLRRATKLLDVDADDTEWLSEVRIAIKATVSDYLTKSNKSDITLPPSDQILANSGPDTQE